MVVETNYFYLCDDISHSVGTFFVNIFFNIQDFEFCLCMYFFNNIQGK